MKDKLHIIDCGKYCVVSNMQGSYDNHTHIKKYKTAEVFVKLVRAKEIPRSDYLRESAKRVTLDDKYIEAIEHKQDKDRQKSKYYNVNKGVR